MTARPTLAVYKFASCDGCQLTLRDREDDLLDIVEVVQIANFPEASREVLDGPYDLTLVEGSITTPHDARRIVDVRKQSRFLVTIGACATAGGIQALRNWADVAEYTRIVYAHPQYISTLARSQPVAELVPVDFELRGCPISKEQLVEVVTAFINGRRPRIPTYSVCVECKRRGNPCVMVDMGIPCMGPVTQAGCGAICPSYHRGCYGCFGPMESANTDSLAAWWRQLGADDRDLVDAFRGFNAWADAFRAASDRHEAAIEIRAAR